MSKTKKDLKSHKKGFGKYGLKKPKRKLTPLAIDASIISGKRNEVIVFTDNDISQDGFNKQEHWHNAKNVKSLRKQLRIERQSEKSSARQKIKATTKKEIENYRSSK